MKKKKRVTASLLSILLLAVMIMLTSCFSEKTLTDIRNSYLDPEVETILETMTLEEYKEFSDLFENDLYQEIDLLTCVEKRISEGGTSVSSVEAQIAYIKERI